MLIGTERDIWRNLYLGSEKTYERDLCRTDFVNEISSGDSSDEENKQSSSSEDEQVLIPASKCQNTATPTQLPPGSKIVLDLAC